MKVRIPLTIAMVASMFFGLGVKAQDMCSNVLANAYDTSQTGISMQTVRAAKLRACSTGTSAQNYGGNIGYGDLSVALNSTSSETEAWCRSDETIDYMDYKFSELIKTVNPSVIQAWSACMSAPGAKISLQPTSDPAVVVLSIAYNASQIGLPPPLISDLTFSNLTCPTAPAKGTPISVMQRHICSRPNKYISSAANINVQNVNAPEFASILASPQPIVAKNDMTGTFQSPWLGGLLVTQTGNTMTYRYDEGPFRHTFIGHYSSPTKIVGYQSRQNIKNGCVARMYLEFDATSPSQLCMTFGRLDPDGKAQCDLPAGFRDLTTCSQRK